MSFMLHVVVILPRFLTKKCVSLKRTHVPCNVMCHNNNIAMVTISCGIFTEVIAGSSVNPGI